MTNITINIEHLTRVEGHGNIIVNVSNGQIEKCQWQVPEAPRFFEAMVRGQHYTEVARVTSRICGICSIGHSLVSVKATENALGIKVSEQTNSLRQLLKHAENFDSNILHVYLLAAPDLLGAKSAFPLIDCHPDIIKTALQLKQLAHEWGAIIAGRTTHPTTIVPGGFSKTPTQNQIIELKQKLEQALPQVDKTVDTLVSLKDKIPNFERASEYISLSDKHQYAIYNGFIQSSYLLKDKVIKTNYPVTDYLSITNEYISQWSTAKYCKNIEPSYMVGALARFNNNFQFLHSKAKQVAKRFGLSAPLINPYLNNLAQVVELVNDIYTSIELLENLIHSGVNPEPLIEPQYFSQGVSAVEAPRGILFHEYEYDNEGLCINGNFVIPTNQNHANIQYDFEKLVPELLAQNKTQEEMELALEMLVRAYDPCISCSTHFLKVKFVK